MSTEDESQRAPENWKNLFSWKTLQTMARPEPLATIPQEELTSSPSGQLGRYLTLSIVTALG